MKTYIAILRGINVSGHKAVKMLELLKLFDVLHLKNAKTYIQSGNVVFQAKKADEQSLQKNIEKEISKKFGFEVPVLIKPATDITTILKSNPFLKQNDIDQSKLHVTFIDGFINKKIIDCLSEQTFGSDEFTVGKNVIYLHCPNGYGNTKLSNTFWENKLKATATTRNWKTVNELKKLADELDAKKLD